MHAGWYDLAPVDSILKVIMLWVNGNSNPYSPFESFLISFASGLTLYFLVYTVVKNLFFLENMLPLISALLAIHPYAFLPGAPITPTNIATALALSSLLAFLILQQKFSRSYLVISIILFITSLLAHPFSLSVLIFVVTSLLAKYFNRSLTDLDIQFLLLTSALWLAKTVYTATIYGVTGIWSNIVDGIFQFQERETLIAFRSIGYSQLPKLSLAAFSASIGILSGISIVLLYNKVLGDRFKRYTWYELVVLFFTSLTGLASFLAMVGGQSRYIFHPFASLFFILILFYSKSKNSSIVIKALLALAAILTVLTPNFIPDQYSFYMASKIGDEVMFKTSEILFEKLEPEYIIDRFHNVSANKLYFDQKREYIRNEGWSGLIVDKIILRDIIKTKSYWDFLNRGPFDDFERCNECTMADVVFDSNLARVLSVRVTHRSP